MEFPYSPPIARFEPNEHIRILLVAAPAVRKAYQAIAEEVGNRPKVDVFIVADVESEILDSVEGVHGLVGCPRSLFSEELLGKNGNKLQWLHVGGAGVEEFLISPVVNSPMTLTNGRIIQGPEVADHALALLLSLTRNVAFHCRQSNQPAPRPIELRNKVATVVGPGGIGLLIVERLRAFGANTVTVGPDYIPMLSTVGRHYQLEELRTVLEQSDIVMNASPHTSRSDPLFGNAEFEAIKEGAFFVNVSRGKTVNTDALTAALTRGQLSGAGLDVTDPEPLPANHPLRSMANVVITPHIAGLSEHNRDRAIELVRANVLRFIENEPLLNVVDKSLGY